MTAVPQKLREERRWITWKHLDGKKPPCDARGKADPNWNKAEAWVDYEEAVARFAACELIDGVGFVLGAGWTGIDFDACRDPKSGQVVPQASAALGLCPGAYAEVSPSEEGFKVFGRGAEWLELNFAAPEVVVERKASGYFCVTGIALDEARTELPDLPLDQLAAYFGAKQGTGAPSGPVAARERPVPTEGASVAPGGQENAVFREACALRNRNYQEPEIAQALWGLVQAGRFPQEEGKPPWTFADCQEKARSAGRYTAPKKAALDENRATIVVSTDLVHVIDQAIKAVADSGIPVYVRARSLVTIVRDGSDPRKWLKRAPGAPAIYRINEVLAREILARAANWMKVTAKSVDSCMPPPWVAPHLLERRHWPFPYLEMITETPCFLADGRVLDEPGHDDVSGVLYDPIDGVEWPEIAERPTLEEARAAGKVLLEPVTDMPFVGLSDVAAYVAAVLTLVGRQAVSGPVPLFPIRAKAPASGKGLLAAVIGIIGTGRAPAITTMCEPDELRKRITSIALAGTPLILLDDITGSLGSDVLASALTATTWEDRVLGVSEMTNLPLRAVWLATGNNVGFQRTLGRRVVPIDLDAKCEHPEDRKDFKIPDLLQWTKANRPRLVTAALTILRAYHVAGRPAHKKPKMGSFEAWDDLVRGAVIWLMEGNDPAGTEDESRARGRIRATADDDLADMHALLVALRERFENTRWTTSYIWEQADTDTRLKLVLDAACPCRGGRPSSLQSLRYKIRALEGRPCGDLTLHRVAHRVGRAKENWWAVLEPEEKDTPAPASRDEGPDV